METIANELYHVPGLRYQHYFALYAALNLIILACFPFGLSLVIGSFPIIKLRFLKIFPRLLALFIITLIPSVFSGFLMISENAARGITFSIYLIIIYSSIDSIVKVAGAKDDNKKRTFIQNARIAFLFNPQKIIFMFAMATACALFMPNLTNFTCVTYYNKIDGAFYFVEDALINTGFLRSLYMPKICPPGPPCHVYATLPYNTSSSVFINAHTAIDVNELEVHYYEKSLKDNAQLRKMIQKSEMIPLEVDETGRRHIHSTLLIDLKPETDYVYELVYQGGVKYKGIYRTLPSKDSNTPLKISFGGDMSTLPASQQMIGSLQSADPDVFVIGGDLTYDNGLQGCWTCWDQWFRIFDFHNSNAGRTVPIIGALGNHDIGFNSYAGVRRNEDHLPLWFYFLPQSLPEDKNGNIINRVPTLKERNTYFHHILGNILLLSIDSNYQHDYDDSNQLKWMLSKINQYEHLGKIAIYHSPLYPGDVRGKDPGPVILEKGQKSWPPIFEKYRFTAIFENHHHDFKKTKPLKGGEVDEKNGVVYYGDGSMGIPPDHSYKLDEHDLFEVRSRETHVWIAVLTGREYDIFPINNKGSQIYKTSRVVIDN